MKKPLQNLLIFILGLILIAWFFSSLIGFSNQPKMISLGELAKDINQGKVEKIIVSGNNLSITLKGKKNVISRKETETSLSQSLKNLGVDPLSLRQVSFEVRDDSGSRFWASILIPSLLPFILIVFFFWLMIRGSKKGMDQALNFGQIRAKQFKPLKEKITFNDIADLEEAKEELKEIIDFLKNPQKYIKMGAKVPKGVLLMGAPGTGKTMLARATASEANVPFFYMSGSEFMEMFVGIGASRARSLFQVAKKNAPSIIFIDEIESIGRLRGPAVTGAHEEREQTLNQILTEMDGFEPTTQVVVIGATNKPEVLDPALLRPGRFDRRIVLDLPDIAAREKILKVHSRGKQLGPDVDLKKVAQRTPGFSGADLANLMNEAAITSAKTGEKFITQNNLYNSLEKVILGPEKKSKVISKKEKEISAYHEAGHSLVAACLEEADEVQKVSIISRGFAGGYTLKLPNEENRLKSTSQFLSELAVLFGGYAAEEITFKEVSTGASMDLKQATSLAKNLVTKYGMAKTPPRVYGQSEEYQFLGAEMDRKDYSEKEAELIDKEVDRLISDSYKKAKKLISSNLKVLEAISQRLLEKETIEQEEFEEIIKYFKVKPKSINKIKVK